MQSSRLLFLLFILAVLSSCQKPAEYIIPTNPEGIFAEAMKDGLTEEEANATTILMVDSVQRNTVGKKIPKLIVRNLQNKILNLQDEIKAKTVILSGDIYCGFGRECLFNTFPEANKKLQGNSDKLPIICLIRKTAEDYEDSTKFNEAIKELSPIYKRVLIIDEQEAFKINAINGSTRYYVTKDQIISDLKFGNCTTANIYNELKQYAN